MWVNIYSDFSYPLYPHGAVDFFPLFHVDFFIYITLFYIFLVYPNFKKKIHFTKVTIIVLHRVIHFIHNRQIP